VSDKQQHVPVLVAGAGLAGLCTALFLSWHQVPCLVVERHRGISPHPRARGINPQAMELMRSVGLEEEVRATESARALARNTGVLAAQSLAGHQLGALHEQYFMDVRTDLSALSPSGWCLCHQDEFEPVVRRRAEELGARFSYFTELESFEQGADGVTARLRDRESGEVRTVTADYLVGADGPASPVREALGIGVEGPGTTGHFLNIHFEADLAEELGERRFIMCYTFNDVVRGALMPLDNARRWLLHVVFDPATEDVASFTDERCRELVRAAAGVPELEVKVLGAIPWEAAGRTATSFGAGRVFLVGDAAHVMPPSGAFGSNTGLQDAHNLAWKLAAVLRGDVQGDAAQALLDSYGTERKAHVRELTSRIKGVGAVICERDAAKARARDAKLLADCGGAVKDTPRQDILPKLDTGFLAAQDTSGRGTLFPQPRLAASGALMDHAVGGGWRLVLAEGAGVQQAVPRGITIVALARTPEAEGVVARWMERHGCRAALVRPDHYVYGTAASSAETAGLLADWRQRVVRSEAVPA